MFKNKIITRVLLLAAVFNVVSPESIHAQKYYTKSGSISFFSKTALENIQAVNRSVVAILDEKNGSIQVSALIKGFEFEKALMQEHFNENYMESDKYPKAVFSGTVQQNDKVNYLKEGPNNVIVKGNLMLHNESKDIDVAGRIMIVDGTPQLMAEFNIILQDYNITIPSLVANKVSKIIQVRLICTLDKVLN